jgi:O-acetyl-ADP-ribose deacetylase
MQRELRIVIEKGDIIKFHGDAIVNAANTDLVLGGGVAGAIRRAGGPSIQEECKRIGPIPRGEAAVTGAGDLPVKYVIHAAAMGFSQPCTAQSLRQAVANSLKRCLENGVRSVAFPALGMGIAGFPLREGAQIMLQTVGDYLRERDHPEQVHFVLFDEDALQIFREAFRKQPS